MSFADHNKYHLSDQQYGQIIDDTQTALTNMRSLYNMVDGQLDMLLGANISTSGTAIGKKIAEWNQDFNTVIGQLDNLKTSAETNRDISRKAANDAHDTAA